MSHIKTIQKLNKCLIFDFKNQTKTWKSYLEKNYSSMPKMPECQFVPPKYTGPDYSKLVKIRENNLNPCLKTYYRKPIMICSGHMQWLFDQNSKRYLDMFGGIVTVSVGHCHPKVTEAATKQLSTLWHTTNIYLHPKIHEYAEKLTNKLPGDLKVAFLVNSGSEATDFAALLARTYTQRNEIISLRNGYHGLTHLDMGITGQSHYKYPTVLPSGIEHAMNPDVFKGLWGGSKCRDSPVQTLRTCSCLDDKCEAADKYYEQLKELYSYSLPKRGAAAFIVEAIQGIGGTVQYPKGYIKKAVDLVRANGGLYIADEVQTGFGRTGEHFWGFEMHGIIPDIVTMAKGIANGFPMGAVVTTPEIAKCMDEAAFFNTFGGNPVGCAIGSSVLDVIEEEKCQQNCHELGTYMLLELEKLRNEFDCVGDVRGKGLMIGVEMVESKKTNESMSNEKFMNIWEDARNMGVLFGRGSMSGNTFRIKPPMCITKEDVNYAVAVLRKAIENNCN